MHITRDHGLPKVIRTDNGPKFLAEAIQQWTTDNNGLLELIQPGKPTKMPSSNASNGHCAKWCVIRTVFKP